MLLGGTALSVGTTGGCKSSISLFVDGGCQWRSSVYNRVFWPEMVNIAQLRTGIFCTEVVDSVHVHTAILRYLAQFVINIMFNLI